ncbi:MAG: rRNA maturation RNase YbeY [Oscillospiraceae bacterium]|jgi:probable rRNA maturation factor|nr:rRNA maturation RNase YbeY [Oscillospiraceae bacterium]
MRHKIFVRSSLSAERERALGYRIDPRDIRDAVSFTLEAEDVPFPCEVAVIITDDGGIREINRAQRGIDEPTDVLSFPLQDFSPGQYGGAEYDIAAKRVPLGDVALSAERVIAQAAEYGNTPSREVNYLTVHSTLHLLGYDHADGSEQKRQMRAREKEIMRRLGYEET